MRWASGGFAELTKVEQNDDDNSIDSHFFAAVLFGIRAGNMYVKNVRIILDGDRNTFYS